MHMALYKSTNSDTDIIKINGQAFKLKPGQLQIELEQTSNNATRDVNTGQFVGNFLGDQCKVQLSFEGANDERTRQVLIDMNSNDFQFTFPQFLDVSGKQTLTCYRGQLSAKLRYYQNGKAYWDIDMTAISKKLVKAK